MALFKYRAVDRDGNSVEGTMEEESARRVVMALQEMDLTVNAVEEVGRKPGLLRREARLKWEDLAQLNDQMVTITRSGLPLAPAIAAMARDLRNPRLKAILEQIRRDIEAGRSLSEAFERHPQSFPPVYTALIRAGEATGNLSGVFDCLSTYSKKLVELKSSVQELLAYPLFLIAFAIAIVLGLLVKVVPVYAEIFHDFGGELPAPTRLLVDMSDLVVGSPWVVAGVLAALAAVCLFVLPPLFRTESGGYRADKFKLLLPVFGKVYGAASLARFCRALGMLLEAQVPLLDSLNLAAAASGNAVLMRAAMDAARRVSGGSPLAEAFKQTGYFGSSFCWLVGNAEERGNVAEALLVLEDDYERSVDHMRKWVMMMAGPVTVIVIGLVIGYIVVSLYLPIFTLGDVVSGV